MIIYRIAVFALLAFAMSLTASGQGRPDPAAGAISPK